MTSEKYEINFEDECGRCADNTQKPHPETCSRTSNTYCGGHTDNVTCSYP